MKDVRIAAAVFNSIVGQPEMNLSRMIQWLEKASDLNADIICFPEFSLTGYSPRIATEDYSLRISSHVIERLKNAAVENRITVLAGLSEKRDNEKYYASHLVLLPDGEMNVYRKVHLAPPEKGRFSAGDDIPVFKHPKITFGIQLCYDAHFPEMSTHMTLKGAELIFMPHASPNRDSEKKYNSWMRHMSARAFDNSLFIAACNQTGQNGSGLEFPGVSLVLDPSGEVICKDISGKENLLVSDLKAREIESTRGHKMKHFFPNRRADLYDIT